jgi:hypothetical protein
MWYEHYVSPTGILTGRVKRLKVRKSGFEVASFTLKTTPEVPAQESTQGSIL